MEYELACWVFCYTEGRDLWNEVWITKWRGGYNEVITEACVVHAAALPHSDAVVEGVVASPVEATTRFTSASPLCGNAVVDAVFSSTRY